MEHGVVSGCGGGVTSLLTVMGVTIWCYCGMTLAGVMDYSPGEDYLDYDPRLPQGSVTCFYSIVFFRTPGAKGI